MFLRVGVLFAFAQALSGQAVVGIVCEGGSASAGTDYRMAAPGPVPPMGIRVSALEAAAWFTATANLQILPLPAGAFARVDASATATQELGTVTARGDLSVLITFRSEQPLAGMVTIAADGTQAGLVPSAIYSLDVGADGSQEFSSPKSHGGAVQGFTIPAVLGPNPLKLRIWMMAGVSVPVPLPSAQSWIQVGATFSTTPASWFTSIGEPCGAMLTGHAIRTENTEFRLQASGAPVTPDGYFVFGPTPIRLSIPPTDCLLRTDIAVAIRVPVILGGTADLKVTTPSTIKGLARGQFLALTIDTQNVARWWTSNLLEIIVP